MEWRAQRADQIVTILIPNEKTKMCFWAVIMSW